MKTNENDAMGGGDAGYASLQNTPGQGEVIMPTSTSVGSGDTWGNILDFKSWMKKKKRKKKKSSSQ
jgi:hypothetical protein